ncbi:hypothetical protein LXA43DRAFT_670238 [Ganoderma leucocontextum]|nr:hypothetical protein LXA43DRAFT_670238 [Ganoderma leucocontextum]
MRALGAVAPPCSFPDPSVFPLDCSARPPAVLTLLYCFTLVLEGGVRSSRLLRSSLRAAASADLRFSFHAPTRPHPTAAMVLVHRQWGWDTYGQTNSWAGFYTSGISESFSSEDFAPPASQAAQTHTVTSISTTAAQYAADQSTTLAQHAAAQSTTAAQYAAAQSTTAVQHAAAQSTPVAQHAAAQSTTDTPTQKQASTESVAMHTAANTRTTASGSPTAFGALSPAGATAPRSSASDHGATSRSSGASHTSAVSRSLSSGGLGRPTGTVSLPGSNSTARPTATGSSSTARPTSTGSSSTAQPIVTGSSSNAGSSASPAAHRVGKGEIAAIVLGIVLALGLCGLLCYLRRRRGARRRDSSFIQYPFSSDATATATMVEVPPHAFVPPTLVPLNTPAEWDAYTDAAESPPATLTFGSPAGAWGGGGLTMSPLDDKAQPRSHAVLYPATAPSPRSTDAFAFSFPTSSLAHPPAPASPGSSRPLVPPRAAHSQLFEVEGSTLPYPWDRPPPSPEYLPPDHQRSTFKFRASGGGPGPGSSPKWSSFGTVAATPLYSSGVPHADMRPPSYSRF